MLTDELQEITLLAEQLEIPGYNICWLRESFTSGCEKIKIVWQKVLFSSASDIRLGRYFQYHFQGISQLADTLFSQVKSDGSVQEEWVGELCSLLEFGQKSIPDHFPQNIIAPRYLKTRLLTEMEKPIAELRRELIGKVPDNSLFSCLRDYIDHLTDTSADYAFSFRSLSYFRFLVTGLAKLGESSEGLTNSALTNRLFELNFNHLAFFIYWQETIKNKTTGLQICVKLNCLQQLQQHVKSPVNTSFRYDLEWPSLATMAFEWLTEEIAATENTIRHLNLKLEYERGEKLALNLSVAHLALFIRLFFDEKLLQGSSLTDIFKFISRRYSTRKQKKISAGSLSKEFYSTTQVTAAVVRDMLLKMVSRINHNFFPAWAVIIAAVHLFAKTR